METTTSTSGSGQRRRTHLLLEGPPEASTMRAVVQFGLLGVIIVSTAALVLETLPALAGLRLFLWIEVATVAVFTAEYLARAWSCTEDARYRGAVRGRLRYLRSPMALVDLIAILPFYLAMLPIDLRFLRLLRVLRLFRLAKLARHVSALQMLGRAVASVRYELVVTLCLAGILLLMASASMYYVEHELQPEAFSSIPATMWWAIATLTTVGYGDVAPITSLGRLLGGVIAVLGIAMLALPTGILGAAFVDTVQKARATRTGQCPTCGRPLPESARS
jgi:voltage-gated potassium channel